jgi:GDPmannose 4,6-dehydratase
MLQQPHPDDFVIGTGVKHTVRDFASAAFAHVGLDWQMYVETDPKLLRPADVNTLCADPSKARRVLGWQPKVSFAQLVSMMVDADLQRVRAELESSHR